MLTSSPIFVRERSPRSTPADHVAHARGRLERRVLASLAADGSSPGVCEARVLESALALRLFERVDVHPAARGRLIAYLEAQRSSGDLDPFQSALTSIVLGEPTGSGAGESPDGYLRGFEHFTSGRKRVLFGVVREVIQGRELALELGPEDFAVGPEEQRWVAVLSDALAVLYFSRRGRRDQIRGDQVASLLATAAPSIDGIWEQYLLGHLVTLLALHALPEHAALVRRRVDALVDHQRPSGGFGFITRMEVFSTATAGLALCRAGVGRGSLRRTGDLLAGLQRPDGGWGYAIGVEQSDLDDTAYCVELLRAVDPICYRAPLTAAERYILSLQNLDGGFPTFARGGGSEVAMTAAALRALGPRTRHHREACGQGLRYILDHQRPDGAFERSWSRAHANAIFRALLALEIGDDAGGRRAQAEGRARAHLRAAQNDDGGWGHAGGDPSDPISSAYALIALARFDDEAALRRGLDYLVQRQRDDGGYTSRPDGAGPRPLAYDVPALADHFVLLAFAHARPTRPTR